MTERWKVIKLDSELVERLINESVNLLATMYGRIYFPTYGNSLKDAAHWLGFRWASPHPSGAAAALLRRCWELTSDEQTRRELIAYNADDCHAAEVVAKAISGFCDNKKQSSPADLETVNVGSLEVEFQRTFGKFLAQVPEFEKINSAAYWDYRQSKVYVRTSKHVRQRESKQAQYGNRQSGVR